MKQYRMWVIAAALVIGLYLFFGGIDTTHKNPEGINLSDIAIEIADTEAKQEQGLSGRESVPANYGMLFVFPDSGEHGFWMKEMKVPLDIIWIKDTGEIVGIEYNVQPESYPAVFYPPEPVSYVLEVAAGQAEQLNFWRGKKLDLVQSY